MVGNISVYALVGELSAGCVCGRRGREVVLTSESVWVLALRVGIIAAFLIIAAGSYIAWDKWVRSDEPRVLWQSDTSKC